MKNYFLSFKSTKDAIVTVILNYIRIYYGYLWLTSGFEKVLKLGEWSSKPLIEMAYRKVVFVQFNDTTGMFDQIAMSPNTGAIGEGIITEMDPLLAPIMQVIYKNVLVPLTPVLDYALPIIEVIVGVFLILGFLTFWMSILGVMMNFAFLLSGVVYPNVHYIIAHYFITKYHKKASLFGLDGLLRYCQEKNAKIKNKFLIKILSL